MVKKFQAYMKQLKQDHPSYKETRWHLLRVEKNGSLRPFVHFRGVAMMVAGLIFVMAGAIGWLLVEWLDTRGKLVAIQEDVSRQNSAMEAIRNEKESVLVRLAITESKLKAFVSGPPMEKQSEPPAVKEEEQVPPDKKTSSGNTPKAPQATVPPQTIKASGMSPEPDATDMDAAIEKVTADNLFICASPDETLLSIEFKVINMGSRDAPVSGHAFVILKDAHAEQDQWLVVPRAMLMDGKPVQSKGQRFRIYNYRTIKFKVVHENPGVFVQATIFIFKDTGELIFERDFSLEPIRCVSITGDTHCSIHRRNYPSLKKD